MTKIERLDAPNGLALHFFLGYLGSTLDRKRSVSVSDWNDAVRVANEEYGTEAVS